MRDVNRIEPFLNEFGELWKNNFPDWRFGQLINNFLVWLHSSKSRDCFFPEEDAMINYFKEYCEDMTNG